MVAVPQRCVVEMSAQLWVFIDRGNLLFTFLTCSVTSFVHGCDGYESKPTERKQRKTQLHMYSKIIFCVKNASARKCRYQVLFTYQNVFIYNYIYGYKYFYIHI
jgi:hypothetical protein